MLMESSNSWPFCTGLFYWAWWFQGSSMLRHKSVLHSLSVFFLFVEFIGVMLVNKIIQVLGVHFHNTSCPGILNSITLVINFPYIILFSIWFSKSLVVLMLLYDIVFFWFIYLIFIVFCSVKCIHIYTQFHLEEIA